MNLAEPIPLTDGQRSAWELFADTPPGLLNRVLWWPVSEHGTADIEKAVRWAVDRHEVLRTTFHQVRGGEPVQRVDPLGIAPIAHWPAMDARAAVDELCAVPLDLASEPPARWGVLDLGADRRWLICVIHHLAAGNRGQDVLREEVGLALSGDGGALDPADAPRLLGERDRSPAGARRKARGRTRLAAVLDNLPIPVLAGDGSEPGAGRFVGEVTSAAVHRAVRTVAQRSGAPPSAVLLAAMTAALGERTEPVCWKVMSDRAGRVRGRVLVSYEPWFALVSVGPCDTDLPRLAGRTWSAMLDALRHDHGGDAVLDEELRRATDQRGTPVGLPLWYNFVAKREPSEGESSITVAEVEPGPGAEVGVFVWHHPDRTRIAVYADRSLLDRDSVERLVHRVTETVIDAAR